MTLSLDESQILLRLLNKRTATQANDWRLLRYYEGTKRLSRLGANTPEMLRIFETFVAWPEVVVEAIVERSDLRYFTRPGDAKADMGLSELATYNNLDAEVTLHNRDKLVYGRAFWSVGANELDPEMPFIRSESPRDITVEMDQRTRSLTAALRIYSAEEARIPGLGAVDHVPYAGQDSPASATLFLPHATIWLERVKGKWIETGRDDHNLGRIALVMTLNRRMSGRFEARSEMAKVIPITDGCTRSLTNMLTASETLAVPQRYALGLSKGDFVDAEGNPLPVWETYFGAIWASANKDAKLGSFPAADLTGFHDTVKLFGQLAASVTGYPAKYFGNFTSNPPAEGAIKAEEARLVKTVEMSNREVGVSLGWTIELAERFAHGTWPERNKVSVEWFDPATPTTAQRADAVQKLSGGVPILSREGAWDELGWSEPRKARERAYFAAEDRYEPVMGDLEPNALDRRA